MAASAERVLSAVGQLDPQLHSHLVRVGFDVRAVVTGWTMTLFARIFALDTLLQVWDILFASQLAPDTLAGVAAGVFIAKRGKLLECEDGFDAVRQLKSSALTMPEEEVVLELLRKNLG